VLLVDFALYEVFYQVELDESVDFGNVLNKFEDISLVDPLDTLKSIEIGLYCLKSDTLDKFEPRPFVKDRNLL